MDFITDLPLSKGCVQLRVIIDRYIKMVHFIPLKKKNQKAKDLATIFMREIWTLYGIPANIISDRDSRFTSIFWQSLIAMLSIRLRMFTALHPQTDGQTTCVNQMIEIFLRSFINLHQTDWVKLPPLAKFPDNNSTTSPDGMMPFYINYGDYP
jgi:hypothetical protein